jgi:hypothetical protein
MEPTEQYARSVAADDRGFVYTGIGPSAQHLVAYEIATGEHRDILPPDLAGPGWCTVWRGADGRAYGTAGSQYLRLEGWNAVPIPADQISSEPPLRLADGRAVTYDGKSIVLTDPQSGATQRHETGYGGRSQSLFRIALGPDGKLYGSTAMPIHFFQADPDSDQWEELGQPGGGEFYSLLAWKDVLLCAAYSGNSPLMVYRPGQPWEPKTEPSGNPWLIHYDAENAGWRPMAMVAGKGDQVYVGAVSGYGLLGGPLCVFDPATGKVDQYLQLIQDQSVISLAVLPDGTIVGGTTIGGGGGSHPTQTEAKLFLYDPATREKLFETVPVPGQSNVGALAVGPDGLVYGFASGTLFVFDPQARKVIESAPQDVGDPQYNAVAPGPDGELYGVSSRGVFTIDRTAKRARLLAEYPPSIHGGFAIRGRDIFFTSGPQIVSYTLP